LSNRRATSAVTLSFNRVGRALLNRSRYKLGNRTQPLASTHSMQACSQSLVFTITLGLANFSILFSPLSSADPTSQKAALDDEWVIWAAPYLWGLSMNGEAQLGDVVGDVDVAFSDILDDINIGVMGFLDGRKGQLGFFVNPIYSRLRSTEDIDGVKIRVTNDTAIVAFGGYYRWIDEVVIGWEGGESGRIIIEPYAGVRWTHMRVEIDANSEGQVDGNEDWLDPIVGGRGLYAWNSHWDIALAADVGGFGVGSDSSWNAHLMLGYRFKIGGSEAIFRVGYRALHQDYDTGSGASLFQWDVTQSGPIAGVAIKL
jgi:hypothetical protein